MKAPASAFALTLVAAALLPGTIPDARACGGFFCQQVPIDQAGEQIVFRQVGSEITAMVRILYQGNAEDFSWVVPVPTDPELSIGAEATFPELELATRPQFDLERRGEECPFGEGDDASAEASAPTDADGNLDESGVTVERELSVGPFDIQVISSSDGDPESMATWLLDNGYDLSDRGRELLAPYVEMQMFFVALKLRNGESAGSIQPLIMKYDSAQPMIPLRLTAVAARPDMGVLVWIVGEARAVPENYLHVTPNLARLNWYAGPQNAYASYQTLVTDAMDEVEEIEPGRTERGQGFATDFAGIIGAGLGEQLTSSESVAAELARLDTFADSALFIVEAMRGGINQNARLALLQNILPLPGDRGADLYFDEEGLRGTYTAEALDGARASLRASIEEREIEPLGNALALLPEGAYMTRLYTTLSADEMTVDPVFAYNPDMPAQPRTRSAVLEASCDDGQSAWTLTLGEGTGRDGETVISARQPVPFGAPPASEAQPATFTRERTSGDAAPELLAMSDRVTLEIDADGTAVEASGTTAPVAATSDDDGGGFLGPAAPISLALLSLIAAGRRLRRHAGRR